MFKRLLANRRRLQELRALLKKEGAGVVIADLNFKRHHEGLTSTEQTFLLHVLEKQARFYRDRNRRLYELEHLEATQQLTAAQRRELMELRRGLYD